MKKLFKTVATTFLMLGLVACSNNEEVSKNDGVKIGMVTDAGTIDDKSFNQGTWDGIVKYNNDNPDSEIQYIQPNGETTQDYLEAIDNLALTGTEVIVLPGFKFEEALGEAQEQYPDITFVAIDAEPHEVKENTISIFFSEQQASFLTGIASALETKTNKVGFLGGMEVPAVQKLGWGFVAGVAYANANPHRLIHNNKVGGNSSPYDWWGKRSATAKQQLFYYWGGPQVWPSCADVIKTIYDPCPAGWFVPGVDFSNCIANQSTVTAGNFGWNVVLPSGQTAFFPKTGTRWGDATKLQNCNVLGAYWINAIGDGACGAMNFVNNGSQEFQGVANINNPQNVEGHNCLSMGISTRAIRCVRIEE